MIINSASRAYGEVSYWLAIVGIAVALVGCIIATVNNPGEVACTVNKLLDGDPPHIIQSYCLQNINHGSVGIVNVTRYSLEAQLSLEYLGLMLFGAAAVIGVLVAGVLMLRNGSMIYGALAMVIALMLLLSMLGIITINLG